MDDASPLNYGVWNAAVSTSGYLREWGIASELFFPALKEFEHIPNVECIPVGSVHLQEAKRIAALRDLNPAKDIIVTHGCWKYPLVIHWNVAKAMTI